jgi:hypothetical protein
MVNNVVFKSFKPVAVHQLCTAAGILLNPFYQNSFSTLSYFSSGSTRNQFLFNDFPSAPRSFW